VPIWEKLQPKRRLIRRDKMRGILFPERIFSVSSSD
jgi:hypothetical protein